MSWVAAVGGPYRMAAAGCGVTAGAVTALTVAARRELRRARRTAHLRPPVTNIDVHIDPPAGASPDVQPLRVVALGDSAVAGVGARRLDGCLPVQLAARVAAASGRPVHVRSHAVSGARTADVTGLQLRQIDAADPPDVVVVVVGTNDVSHVTAPWRFRRDVARMHDGLRARVDAPVVYCSLPEFRAITVVSRPVRLLAVVYGRLLGGVQRRVLRDRPGAWWVDALHEAGAAFLRRSDTMSTDGYHPSDAGYALLADVLAPAVTAAATGR